ncbi:sodium:proton antiporter [Deinococcus sonorensis]|uniref:Sodium:proton antiporter n=2 Tax=Deinococcus sonorensis TaxID=309891 RepID=A0AAU7U4C2_9DEIO
MTPFQLISLVVSVTALLSFINRRYLRLPTTIGVTLAGLAVSVLLLGLVGLQVPAAETVVKVLGTFKFNDVLFQGLLSFLLFAGALSLNTGELFRQRTAVLTFALVSTALSIVLVGALVYGLLHLVGLGVSWPFALLFGAIISPTDPVAVLDLLKRAKVPARLEALVAGESLFNDGIGVVAFAVIAAIASGAGHASPTPLAVAGLFAQEALGGVLFGAVLGYLAYLLLRQVDDYVVEVLITLAVVTGGYALADLLHLSGPLAMVVAGLLIGQLNDRGVLSDTSKPHFDGFWHLTDEILNTGLFVLIALEVVAVSFSPLTLLLGLACVPIVLFSRAVSVQLPLSLLGRRYSFSPFTAQVMTWGGLRGGIAVALAFSVPPGPQHDIFLVLTYVVVVFSIVVQGLTMGRLARRAAGALPESAA